MGSSSSAKSFVPDFGQSLPHATVAYMAHDDENLYFAFKAFDEPDKIKTSVAARDKIRDDDWICAKHRGQRKSLMSGLFSRQ